MEEYIGKLKGTQLFAGIRDAEISAMLVCLQAKLLRFQRGDYVFREGERIEVIPILTEGRLLVQRDDFWGNRSIVNVIRPGEMFCEAYAAPGSGAIRNDVIAEEDSTVICFDIRKVLTTCSSACGFHAAVIQNLFFSISEKNRRLVQKINHMSKRSTRAKLLSYLSEEAKIQSSSHFSIPFNRQQLADFLCVDRSAMSHELCKMRDEGLLAFDRNQFFLYQQPVQALPMDALS